MHLKKKRRNLYGNACYSRQMSKSERLRFNDQSRSLLVKSVFGKQDINIQNIEEAKLKKLNLNQHKKKDFKIKKHKKNKNLKENQNKNAYIETQIVSQPNFIENKKYVDVRKIVDFHKTLKRTYAKRKTLSKAFQNWDLDKKGYLDHNDLKRIGNRFNMNLNQKEIELLFLLSTGNIDNKIKPSQFISLIADQQFNDLEQKSNQKSEDLYDAFMSKFQQMKNEQQKNKIFELLQFKKKNILKILNNEDIQKDADFNMNKKQFQNALKNLKVDQKFLSQENIEFLFNTNEQQGKVNFLEFAKQIQDYSLQHGYFRCEERQIQPLQKDKQKELIVDPRSLTLNKVEFLYKNLHKIRGRMKKKDLNYKNFLKELENFDEPLNQENLQNFLKLTFDKNKINFSDNEIKIIIRGFNYDENEIYDKKELTQTLFNTNMEDFIINQRKRVLPKLEENQSQNKLIPISTQRMNQIQKELDEKIFAQNKTKYNVYKSLDENKDNMISNQEFKNFLTKNNICNREEAGTLLNKLNLKDDCHLYFKEFMRALHQNQQQAYNAQQKGSIFGGSDYIDSNIEKNIKKVQNLTKYYENMKEERRVKNLQNNCNLKRLQLQ